MKLKRNGLAIALSAVVGLGAAGQAAADVYGLGYLDIDNLDIDFFNGDGSPNPGAITFFTFSTGAEATLNLTSDPVDGAASCSTAIACGPPGLILSGTEQNATTPVLATRAPNAFNAFLFEAEYSNAESAILDAQVGGAAFSSTEQIANGNLKTGTSAQANTVVNSNTSLAFTFTGAGSMNVNFDAIIDVLAQVTGGDLGLAQANSGISLSLTAGGTTLASWAPDGVSGTFAVCAFTCVDTEAATNLNNALSSPGAAVQVTNRATGGENYNFNVSGLSSSQTYGLALNSTTSIDLAKVQPVPEPGTLLLLGAGLLGVGMCRRKKHAAT